MFILSESEQVLQKIKQRKRKSNVEDGVLTSKIIKNMNSQQTLVDESTWCVTFVDQSPGVTELLTAAVAESVWVRAARAFGINCRASKHAKNKNELISQVLTLAR